MQSPFPVLTDGVVTLRCLDQADAAAHVAGEDPEQVRWLNEGHTATVDGVAAWIRASRAEWLGGGPRRNVGVRDARTGELVGNAEAHLRLPGLAAGEVNLSYAVFPARRGEGIARRAVLLLCSWLRRDPLHRTAVIRVDPGNLPSHGVPAAAGFTPTTTDDLIRYELPLHPRIRVAGPGEYLDEAATIWAEATAARDGLTGVAPLSLARPPIQRVVESSPRSLLLVALGAGDRVDGFAAVEPMPADASTADVRFVGVRPGSWGGGVGRRLMTALPARLTAAGFGQGELDVYLDNPRAVRLYESLGWRPAGDPVAHPRTGRLERRYRVVL